MAHHQADLVRAAVTPSAYDVAIASEVILEALRTTGYQGTRGLFEPIEERLSNEPVPDVVRSIEGVTEVDVRKVRAATTTMTALAELEARGAILPSGSPPYEHPGWHVPYSLGGHSTAYSVDGLFTYRVAAGYRARLADLRSPLVDSPTRSSSERKSVAVASQSHTGNHVRTERPGCSQSVLKMSG
jgi:hypothetical protein